MTGISRRSVAKGALWAAPAVSVAAAAPALAASCTPASVSRAVAVAWVSTQTNMESPTGDPEYHTVQYSFTNNGPDALPVGSALEIAVVLTVAEAEMAELTVSDTSPEVTATATNASTVNGDQSTTMTARVAVNTVQEIASGATFVVTVLATYGYMPSGAVDSETVTAESPQVFYVAETCTTTTVSVAVSGASDGTSYTS